MKLLVINPNTSVEMTHSIDVAARAIAAAGTEIRTVSGAFGPLSIEGHFDEVIAAAAVVEQVRDARDWSPDGIVIACFGDPGLDGAREASDAPVLGIAEAAFHAASMVATGFSVVTTMSRTCIIAEHLVQRYGFGRACRGIHGTDIPVLELEDCNGETFEQMVQVAEQALERDRSGAIVLGCAGMASACQTMQQRLGVPVIDGVAAAVTFAQALATLKVGTSKRGDYARPLPKAYVGWRGWD
ncbi:aspartate/glutamate racemase family protein [Orrella marina]|nr:aspartate/glutamate racemase family protein [Orrella marina]